MIYVVEIDGKITTKSRNIPLIQNVRGKLIPMAGVSNVASDPVSRRKGHVRKLMEYLVRKSYDDDLNVSTLYPFKDTFYAKFGYVNVNPNTQLVIKPSQLRKWKTLPEGYTTKRTNDVMQIALTFTRKYVMSFSGISTVELFVLRKDGKSMVKTLV